MDTGEIDTPYVKSSQAKTPQKSDHPHEYIRVFTMSKVRRFDGSVSVEEYKFTLPDECVRCGHRRQKRSPEAVEVQVSVREYRQLSEKK